MQTRRAFGASMAKGRQKSRSGITQPYCKARSFGRTALEAMLTEMFI